MKINALFSPTKTKAAVLGGLSLALLNVATPIEVVNPLALGESQVAIAQTEEDINVQVYQTASPAIVTIDTPTGSGSGVLIESDGLILTNAHVVDGSDTVTVVLANREQYEGRVVAYGEAGADLAAVEIDGRNLPTVDIATGPVLVGQRAFAIGNPFGRFEGTFTIGIISRIDATRGLIQTDAAINPGNSGGALLNSRGELIGINTSIFAPGRTGESGNIGIGFAITVDQVNQFLASVENGSAPTTPQESPFLLGTERPPTRITIGNRTIQGELGRDSELLPADDSYYNAYSFEGREGQRILVEMDSAEFDPYLILLSPQGQDIAQDDDGGGNLNARLSFTLPEDGTYTILANSYSPRETGAFELSLSEDNSPAASSSQQARPVTGTTGTIYQPSFQLTGVLSPQSETLESDGSRFEEYFFEGSAGQRLAISMSSQDFDTVVFLVGPDGDMVAYNDDVSSSSLNSGMSVTLPQNGVYTIIANAWDSTGLGQFELSVDAQ